MRIWSFFFLYACFVLLGKNKEIPFRRMVTLALNLSNTATVSMFAPSTATWRGVEPSEKQMKLKIKHIRPSWLLWVANTLKGSINTVCSIVWIRACFEQGLNKVSAAVLSARKMQRRVTTWRRKKTKRRMRTVAQSIHMNRIQEKKPKKKKKPVVARFTTHSHSSKLFTTSYAAIAAAICKGVSPLTAFTLQSAAAVSNKLTISAVPLDEAICSAVNPPFFFFLVVVS